MTTPHNELLGAGDEVELKFNGEVFKRGSTPVRLLVITETDHGMQLTTADNMVQVHLKKHELESVYACGTYYSVNVDY